MKKIIKNKYANFYLNAASKFGLSYTIINEEVGLVKIFNNTTELGVSSNVLSLNSQLSSSLSVNKVKTSTLLKAAGVPVPAFKTFTSIKKATDYAMNQLQNKKQVVIKPITGSLSIGITVNPSGILQVTRAVKEAFEGNSTIMIEEYITGRHFRITVLDSEVIAVTERIASYVTGNGKDSIKELIAQKNKLRKKQNLPAIMLRKKDLQYLRMERIELSKVYPKDVNITLQLGCDLDIGGERVRVDRKIVPMENIRLFIKATNALGLKFAGIDYITPDILTPHTQITTAINEINSAPDSDVHYRDTYPHSNYAAERIVEKVFGLQKPENLQTEIITDTKKQPFIISDFVSSLRKGAQDFLYPVDTTKN